MTRLVGGDGSYLKTWDQYGEVEGDLFLERARAVGSLRIHPIGSTRNSTVEVAVDGLTIEQARALESVKQLELTERAAPVPAGPAVDLVGVLRGALPPSPGR